MRENLVYIPAYRLTDTGPIWTSPESCVWAGCENMRSKHPLKVIYETKIRPAADTLESVGEYFTNTLKVPNCDWTHCIDEIRYQMSTENPDFDWIRQLYKLINEAQSQAGLQIL
jgi:hypothetical protein